MREQGAWVYSEHSQTALHHGRNQIAFPASELTAHSAIVPMYWSKAAVMFVVCGGYGGTPSLQWRRGLGMRGTTGSDGTEPRWMSFL